MAHNANKKTKFNLLNAFENEIRPLIENEAGGIDSDKAQVVLNKYMEMETELFDSDDLNQIIDKIENEIQLFKRLKS